MSDEATIIRSRRCVIRARASTPPELLIALGRDPDSLIDCGEMIKDGDRTTLVRLEVDGQSVLFKRYNSKGWLHTLTHLPLRSRAGWNDRNASLLRTANIDTPDVLALREDRRGPLRLRSFLLTRFIDGESLVTWVCDRARDAGAVDRIASRFGEIWRILGEHRLGHGDMKATNFIVDENERIWLVDLDSMRRLPHGPTLTRARRRDRERFLRNWRDRPEVEAAFRARIDTATPHGE